MSGRTTGPVTGLDNHAPTTTTPRSRRAGRSTDPEVLLVSHGWPTRGGISAFAESLSRDDELRERFRLRFLNTTRTAERDSGRLRTATVRWAVEDAWRTFRLARRDGVTHVHSALYPTLPLLRALALAAAARAAGSGVLLHVHGAEINSGRASEFAPSRAYRVLARGLRGCTQVLTVAEAGARQVERLAPGTPVAVLDNAVAVDDFTPGMGQTAAAPVIRDALSAHLNDVTSTKQPVTGTTGLVLLATDQTTHVYWYNDLALR